jgi:hypothetical protein
VRGRYYDTFGYELATPDPACDALLAGRNFGLLGGDGELVLPGPRDHRVRAFAGVRRFRYKPDPDFDWIGDRYGLDYRATIWTGDPDRDPDASFVDVRAGYRFERRGFSGTALTSECPEGETDPSCIRSSGLARTDLNHALSGELVFTGEQIWSARYELQINDSNSFGNSLVRQRLELGFTAELPWQWFVTAKGALQLDLFLDPLLLARDVQAQSFVSIDDENRNELALHLSRDLGPNLAVEGRYALFSNEFATRELDFRRQTFYLGAVYRFAPE